MRYSDEKKAMLIEEWRNSGKSAWDYATEKGIIPQSFINWKNRKKKVEQCFVEVPAGIIPHTPHTGEILIEKGDIKVHIPLGIDGSQLRAVFDGLRVTP